MELYRALVEVRYVAPRYLDAKSEIITAFMKQYPEFRVDFAVEQMQATVRMRNSQRGIDSFADGMHCGQDMSFDPFDLETFAREATNFCRQVVRDILLVENAQRIGMRFFYRVALPENKTLTDVTLQNILRHGEMLRNSSLRADKWEFRFSQDDEKFHYTIQSHPEFVKDEESSSEQATGQLVFDIDVFQNEKPVSAITSMRETILEAQQEALEKGEKFSREMIYGASGG